MRRLVLLGALAVARATSFFARASSALKLPSALPEALAPLAAYGDAAAACAAVATKPDDADGWRRLGKLLHGKGRLDAARMALERAADLAPSDSAVRIDLANVQRSIGRFDEATEALVAAADLTGTPDQALCYYRAPGSDEREERPPAASTAALSRRASDTVWVTRLATDDECEWVIDTAERFNEARGGWGNPPPRYAPAGTVADNVRAPHMLVADCPELLAWLNAKLEQTVWPTLAAQFGDEVAAEMWLYDSFLLRFDGSPGRSGLGVHVDDDGLGLSINLLLSDPADFAGGGTYFEDGDLTVVPQRGELVTHAGGLRHASVPTTDGRRYILVGFLRAPRLLVEPPAYLESYCPNAQAAAAAALA